MQENTPMLVRLLVRQMRTIFRDLYGVMQHVDEVLHALEEAKSPTEPRNDDDSGLRARIHEVIPKSESLERIVVAKEIVCDVLGLLQDLGRAVNNQDLEVLRIAVEE